MNYQSKVETAKIVQLGIRTHRNGIGGFPVSKKRQSIFGKLQYPNCVSVTVTLGGPEKRDWPDQTNFYDAKKFRIPLDTKSFEIVRNSKSRIVLIYDGMTEVIGESTTWREGAPYGLGKVARYVYHGIMSLLDKINIPQNEEMFEENYYHSLDMNLMLMSKK